MNNVSAIFKGDKIIWGMIFLLSVVSLLAVYSSTGTLAFRYQEGNLLYYLFRHGGLLLLGILIILVFQNIPVSLYNRLSFLLILLTIPLLIYTLLKGTSLNEASRWITLPGTSISFQSSDFAKFSLIVYISKFLAKYQQGDSLPTFKKDFRLMMITLFLTCGLILPANFSTAALLFFSSIMLLFLGRLKWKYILTILAIGVVGIMLFIGTALLFFPDKGRVSTWKNRIEVYLNKSKADSDDVYQIEQSKIAIASGGFFGKGPGNSTQRNFLPHPYSDFIFAIIIEEYGFIGAMFIMLCYLILLYRVGVIVRFSPKAFQALLAIGLIILLVLQAMINMGVATGIFPVTGQTLPLVSMGGTSIIFTGVSLGIIINISHQLKVEKTVENNESDVNKPSEEQNQHSKNETT
ncbi:MAG: FtsW/RodA/SpoVE family cell cycle protein [Bacteroidales bacterium]|nr:FtsW/RodA/SpoVE family cell cycle protein [Bacteroidales bacterium]